MTSWLCCEADKGNQQPVGTGLTYIERECARRGMRLTAQRRIIARVIAGAADHPDVEELHQRAVKLDQQISLSTVYRTVRLLEDAGILARHDFGTKRARYEIAKDEHHDHLIDMTNGTVIEFRSEEIEKLQTEIARRHGFRLVAHRLEMFGVPLDEDDGN